MGTENHPKQSNGVTRIKKFAAFFKAYMSVSAFVTAALPIPVTALGVIATYKFQTKVLSTYTSLYCFLVFGFIFSIRHQIARMMFFQPKNVVQGLWLVVSRLLPLVLVVLSISFVFMYHRELRQSIIQKQNAFNLLPDVTNDQEILARGLESQTPEATRLMIYYLGMFMTAEAAFMLMAMKEHLQDILKLSDIDLIEVKKRDPCDDSLPSVI